MAGQKACKQCKAIYEGSKCTNCGSEDANENFKGRVIILSPEKSEIAKALKHAQKGNYTIKIG